jgi:hypothetical protein
MESVSVGGFVDVLDNIAKLGLVRATNWIRDFEHFIYDGEYI